MLALAEEESTVSILKNAVDSIAVGLEDFESSDQQRIVSCTRNLFAGILLLFKHKLSIMSTPESDEALIKQRVMPSKDNAGNIIWKGKGGKTVDVQNIKERFGSLDIDVDWRRIDRVNQFRNDIEHYYSNLTHEAIRSLISDSFLIINDFIHRHLGLDPKALLGEKSWAVLIEVNEVYEREKSECDSALEKLEYIHNNIVSALEEFHCEECGSQLIIPASSGGEAIESEFICKSCGNGLGYDEIVKKALSEYYFADMYLSQTDGGDPPITDCPECDGIYLYEEGVCSSCGHSAEHTCQRCGSAIMPEELCSKPFCGYCAHMISKDD